MIPRRLHAQVLDHLTQFPAVALLGPRQVGKTTLARQIADAGSAVYLDLEAPADRQKLGDAALYVRRSYIGSSAADPTFGAGNAPCRIRAARLIRPTAKIM